MIPGASYHRVSTADQNPELAREELRQAAAARGIELAMEVEETGSGARNDRPGLRRVLDAVHAGKVRAVVVWKLDRFGRSIIDILNNTQAIENAGGRFICTSQGIDIHPDAGPESRFFFRIMAAVAELERELIRERTRLGLAKANRLGRRVGRPCLASVHRLAIERMFIEGNGAYAIARQLSLKETTVRRYVRRLEATAKKGPPKEG